MNKALIVFAFLVVILAFTQAQKKPDRPQRPDCLKLKCEDNSKKLLCVRSKKNNCRLLTICNVSRINCQRGPLNALFRVEPERCRGIKPGQKRTCRDLPKKKILPRHGIIKAS